MRPPIILSAEITVKVDLTQPLIAEYNSESIDKKNYAMGIFIDLKKAFDSIDHNILLNKLYHYGIRGISNDWVKTLKTLKTIKQFVQYDDAISHCKETLCDEPQTSILGPIFILMIIAIFLKL